MLEDTQVSTSLINQEDANYRFPPSTSSDDLPSPPTNNQQHEQEFSSSNTTTTTASVPENSAVQNTTRRIRNRKESITRGTASSLAKMVRPPVQHYPTAHNDNHAARNMSPRLTKKQSLVPVSNKHLYPYTNTLVQRRSSWTPLVQQQQQQQQQQQRQRLTDIGAATVGSSSPSPPPVQCSRKVSNTDLKQQQARRPALHTPKNSNSNIHYLQPRAHQQTLKNEPYYLSDFSSSNTTENSNSHDSNRSIINAPNHRYHFLASTMGHPQLQAQPLPEHETTTNISAHNTYKEITGTKHSLHKCSAMHQQPSPPSIGGRKGVDYAACCIAARHHQQQNSSFETPPPCFAPHPPDTVVGHIAVAAASTNESAFGTSHEPCHAHSNVHHYHLKEVDTEGKTTTEAGGVENEEENLPSYMRRPICAACNRNVKVVSSSETTIHSVQQPNQSASNSNSSISTSSRRSSVSITNHPKHKRKPHNARAATATFSTTSSTASIHSDNSSTGGRPHKPTTATTTANRRGGGAQSPTSPIPTLAHHAPKKTKKAPLQTTTTSNSLQRHNLAIRATEAMGEDKWKYLLAQQQVLLTTLLRDENDTEEEDKINNNVTQLLLYLSNNNNNNSSSSSGNSATKQEQYETILLETQIRILQKLTQLVQTRPSSIPNCFSLHMPSSYHQSNQSTSNDSLQQETDDTAALITRYQPQQLTTSWQTKLEYGLAKFRWGMSQWLGNLVGTGDIENQAYDLLGYPDSVTITGVCVTTEPKVLPKNLQRYYHPDRHSNGAAICCKYVIQLTRELRLTKFQLNLMNWVRDEDADSCQFFRSTSTTGLGASKVERCPIKFGILHRRHHCRSCGHVFCQMHSCNRLPLFAASGNDQGEWARVCDACFFSRIKIVE